MVKMSTIKTNFVSEKQRFSNRKTEIFGGQLHAPAAQFFSAVGDIILNIHFIEKSDVTEFEKRIKIGGM